MKRQQSLKRVLLLQSVKRMIPAFMERSIELLETTMLVSTIACTGLIYQANDVLLKTLRPLEMYSVVALTNSASEAFRKASRLSVTG